MADDTETHMPSAGLFSELLNELYAAPLHPEKWQIFFERLCESTDCEMGVFTTSSPSRTEALAGGGINFNPEPLELYNSYYASLDPLLEPAVRDLRHAVIPDEELVRRDDYVKTEFFNDLLVPFGLHYVTVIPCFFNQEQQDFITLFRGNRRGTMDIDSSQLLTFLLPHMTNALEMFHALNAADARSHLLHATLNEIQAAAFVLGANGRVIQMNLEAETVLQRKEGVFLKGGRLRARKHVEDSQLAALIAVSIPKGPTIEVGRAKPSNSMLISRSAKPPLQLTVVPITTAEPFGKAGSVLCLLSDSLRRPKGLEKILATLYGLTATECRLVDLLLEGLETKEAAERMRMTCDSARFHLKKIFLKTGTGKQSELMRLLMSLTGTS